MVAEVRRIHTRSGGTYGVPRVHAELCMPSWSAAASAAWPTWTGPPASRSAATSTPIPGPWSTSTSRSSATSPPVVATGSWAAPLGCETTRPTGQVASSAVITTRGKATGSSTPPLMTLPAGLCRDPPR
jgi:hypothetical protein